MAVKYHELWIKCELVWHSKGRNYWIRMPEYWFEPSRKTTFCFWDTKEISDQFQKDILQKIFDTDMLSECEITKIHAHGAEKKTNKRKE